MNVQIGVKTLVGIAIAVGVGVYGANYAERESIRKEKIAAENLAKDMYFACVAPSNVIDNLRPAFGGDEESIGWFKKRYEEGKVKTMFLDEGERVIFEKALSELHISVGAGVNPKNIEDFMKMVCYSTLNP
ncbi:hypothetical protein [Methyloversatilis sp.]|uniref:hypothetical protein n=1 Tax=Methyloversatilis sp. TaxID=2569862 RepID=UPI0035AF0529